MKHTRHGILLIDLLVAMGIIGVVLLAVMPTLRSEGPLQLVAGSTMLAADIEYAQSRTLSSPRDPTIVVFSDDGTSYWLALLSEPLVPIDDPNGEAWMRVMGEGVASQLDGCTLARHKMPNLPNGGPELIVFDEFGRVENDTDLALTISNFSGDQVVHVRAVTGSVSILTELPEGFAKPADPTPVDPGGLTINGGDSVKGGDSGLSGILGGLLGGGR